MAGAKEKGLVRSEGKEYVMKDGDIVLFRFNVQQGIAGLDEPVQAAFRDAQIVQEHLFLLFVQLGDQAKNT